MRLQIEEGISPLKLFLEIEKKTMCRGSTCSGQVPSIKLLEKSTNCNKTSRLNLPGKFPVIKLECKLRYSKFRQLEISAGMFPEIRFNPRLKIFRFSKFPISLGIGPVSLLSPTSNQIRDEQFTIFSGISPDKIVVGKTDYLEILTFGN